MDHFKVKAEKIETADNKFKPLYKLMVFVFGLWVLSFILLVFFYGWPASAGEFGDMFGAINTLFSGLAFAGVIFAILLQRREFELQREQLELQRHELELTRDEFREQNTTLKIQRFENTFFHMLSLHNELVESCNYDFPGFSNESETILGRQSLVNIYSNFKKQCSNKEKKLIAHNESITLDHINKEYMDFYKSEQHNLGHYFRNLYNIVKFVKNSSISEKRQYTNLLRAQLSTQELALLFYNCLSDIGEKFKPLVEEFALLKNLPDDMLVNPEHKSFYMGSAFGG